MKKYLFSGLIIFCSLFLTACTTKNTSSNSNNSNNETQKETSSSFSLRQLIAQNIPQKCTYIGTNEDGTFESEIIINGKKFSQTIKTKSADGEQTINSVSDGDYVYTWGSHTTGGTFAIKLKADFDTKITPEAENSSSQNIAASQVDLDTDYQGKCSPTVVTDTNFQPPKDIKFEDYSKFLDDIKSSIPSINPKDLE